jgi:hypothetical protein
MNIVPIGKVNIWLDDERHPWSEMGLVTGVEVRSLIPFHAQPMTCPKEEDFHIANLFDYFTYYVVHVTC